MSLRLDGDTQRAIARLARARKRSQSEVVREAVARLIDESQPGDSPYEAWSSVIGIAKGGRSDLSERTGEHVRRLLRERGKRKA